MTVSVIVGCAEYAIDPGKTIAEVLEGFKLSPLITAVQLNDELLRGDKLKNTRLSDGDHLECLVQCAGGSGGAAPAGRGRSAGPGGKQTTGESGSVQEVIVFHDGDGGVSNIVTRLRAKLGSGYEIKVVNFAEEKGDVYVPPRLLESLASYGDVSLPALTMGEVVLKRGGLTNVDELVDLVKRRSPASNDQVDLDLRFAEASTKAASSCCGPSTSSCCSPAPAAKPAGGGGCC